MALIDLNTLEGQVSQQNNNGQPNQQGNPSTYAQQASQMPTSNQPAFQPNYSIKPVDALTNPALVGQQEQIKNSAALQLKQGESQQTANQNFGFLNNEFILSPF